MALSKINIDHQVQHLTNKIMRESNYHTLRQNLLARNPLERVIDLINSELSDKYKADEQAMIEQLNRLACEAQRQSDKQEAASDECERRSDELLRLGYTQELFLLGNTLSQLKENYFQQQLMHNQTIEQLAELEIHLTQVNKSLANVNQLLAQNSEAPTAQVHVHQLPVPHMHPEQAFRKRLTIEGLHVEKNQLILESQRLSSLIIAKKSARSITENMLRTIERDKRETAHQYQSVDTQRTVYLPRKEEQRQRRAKERQLRDAARKTDDPALQQLSAPNLEALKKQQSIKTHELETKRRQLMKKAIALSYPTYLAQLEDALTNNSLTQINFGENSSLKTIVYMIKDYLVMAETEKSMTQTLMREKTKLETAKRDLLKTTQQLQYYQKSAPQLNDENCKLKDGIPLLTKQSEALGRRRAHTFYGSLFGVGTTLFSVGLMNSWVISPLVIAVPSSLAILTMASLTIAIVSHFQKSSYDTQITQNQQKIRANDETLLAQKRKTEDLLLTTIPKVNEEINRLEKAIASQTLELQAQQQKMHQCLDEAEKVSCVYGSGMTHFEAPPTYAAALNDNMIPPPSAPTEELEDQLPPEYVAAPF